MIEQAGDDVTTESILRPGDALRQAREHLGYSPLSVANKLRLRLSIIEDIENNRFEKEAIATFMRGYVRSYAKLVGLDEFELLRQMDEQGHAPAQDHEMQSFSRRTKRETNDSRLMGFTWLMAFVIVGLSGAWWWQNEYQAEVSLLPETLAVTPIEAVIAPKPIVEAVEEEKVLSAVLAATQTPEELIFANPPTLPLKKDAILAVVAELTNKETQLTVIDVPELNYGSDLEFEFLGDCWVEIKNPEGKRLEAKLKKSGQKLAFDGDGPFKIVLGAPGVVKMRYKGELVDLSRYSRRGRVARFTWPQ
jgi:cytoskeleton protein RodZ